MSIQSMELVQEAEIFRESGEKPAKSAQQLPHKEIALEICNVWVKKKNGLWQDWNELKLFRMVKEDKVSGASGHGQSGNDRWTKA